MHVLTFRLHHLSEDRHSWSLRLAFIALILMVPLAATSTSGWIRRLGGRQWQLLHTLVYPSAILSAVHAYGISRSGNLMPSLGSGVITLLLLLRVRQMFGRDGTR